MVLYLVAPTAHQLVTGLRLLWSIRRRNRD
jgi:hypothetical protein